MKKRRARRFQGLMGSHLKFEVPLQGEAGWRREKGRRKRRENGRSFLGWGGGKKDEHCIRGIKEGGETRRVGKGALSIRDLHTSAPHI